MSLVMQMELIGRAYSLSPHRPHLCLSLAFCVHQSHHPGLLEFLTLHAQNANIHDEHCAHTYTMAMDSPSSPTEERQESPQAQSNGAGASGSSASAGDMKPSQTSSILKERRFKLSRCAVSLLVPSAAVRLTLTRRRFAQGMRPVSVSSARRRGPLPSLRCLSCLSVC